MIQVTADANIFLPAASTPERIALPIPGPATPAASRRRFPLLGAQASAPTRLPETSIGIVELSRDEGRALLDEKIQRELGMTLEQFEMAHDNGQLDLSRPEVEHLIMLLPFAR